MERTEEFKESAPLSVCFAIIDHVPLVSAGLKVQLPVVPEAVKEHEEVFPPEVAVTVTSNPLVSPPKEMVGVVTLVMLSEDEAPLSLPDAKVGVDGADGKLGVNGPRMFE
jgi:hypothetical protein